MMQLNSNYKELCQVTLPWKERQKYMHTFDLADIKMPEEYSDYLQPVKSLCASAGAFIGTAHMTVDEKIIMPGMSQRRPKPHLDGCFMTASWDHGPGPFWNHGCNNIADGSYKRMSVIVAASESGCRAWRGLFNGHPANDGDLSHIEDQLGDGEVLDKNMGYLLSPDCVHESMIFNEPTKRSFLRMALPVEFSFVMSAS